MSGVKAGAAENEITPVSSQFLYGYPYVERYSDGVNDPLMSSALYLNNATDAPHGQALFIANDIIYLDKSLVREVRKRITTATGVPEDVIMVTATHTHSAPIVGAYACTRNDPVIPDADPRYRRMLIDRIVETGIEAVENAMPASLGIGVAHADGVGTNRRDPDGPRDPEVPIIVARDEQRKPLACMMVYSMHPTVLHEDSKLISGDFPAYTRRYLREVVFGLDTPVVYHTGTAGNQSPRYLTKGNTFAEAERLGTILGEAAARTIHGLSFTDDWPIAVTRTTLDLPRRVFPPVDIARRRRDAVKKKLRRLQDIGAPREEVRTAETDWFGAEETLTFAELLETGELETYYRSCLPAEEQAVRIGHFVFVALPGELFVEYGLQLKNARHDTYAITLANGDLQGYIVTERAAGEGGYEASNALFDWSGGTELIKTAISLVDRLRDHP